MGSLRELKSRIKSVNSTKKITKAQELIATSRISRAQANVVAAEPYAQMISVSIGRLAAASSLDNKMLCECTSPTKRSAILIVTSDRGMCGGYNNNVLRRAESLATLLREQGSEVVFYVTGQKGIEYFRFRERPIAGAWSGFSHQPGYIETHNVRHHLIDGFLAGAEGTAKKRVGAGDGETELQGFDEVHIVYTEFVSMLTQQPVAVRILPIRPVYSEEELPELGEDLLSDAVPPEDITPKYEFEPDADTLLAALLPKYVSRRIFAAMLDAAASENAARRTAMKAASDNATELVNNLSREANSARQAQITQEISEIVGGVDALHKTAGRD